MAGSSSKEDDKLIRAGRRFALTILTHPIEYAKFLIQIGYEPIKPRPSTTLLGRKAYLLPNVFGYISYIKKVDGTTGCFKGLSAKICANVVNGVMFESVKESIHLQTDIRSIFYEDELADSLAGKPSVVKEFMREMTGRAVGIICSHPFQVIAGRMMAEFIGRETKYSTLLSSVKEIYSQSGIQGFFSGLIPRLIGDLLAVCIITSCTYLVHAYCTEDIEIRNYCNVIIGFLASSFTHPFYVVSNCMIVTSSGLVAGSPPYMPEYKSWLGCWRHLKGSNQIKRGSTLFWRYYTGPYKTISG